MDIVERLRLSVTRGHEPTDDDAIDAADEIEQLRQEHREHFETGVSAGLEEGRAEIERLRAALQRIADQDIADPNDIHMLSGVAWAALERGKSND